MKEKNLKDYLSNTSKIVADSDKLNDNDLLEILRLAEEKDHGVTYGAVIDFVTRTINIRLQGKILKSTKCLVWTTWLLVVATIILIGFTVLTILIKI